MKIPRQGIGGVLLVLCCTPAHAFVCTRASETGPSLAWQTRDIEMRVSNVTGVEIDVDSLRDALAFGLAQWTGAGSCSDLELRLGDITNHQTAGFDWAAGSDDSANMNIVVFRRNESDASVDKWLYPVSTIALTTVTYISSNGRILDADIELNDAGYSFTNCDPGAGCSVSIDLKNTLTHELGHAIGLDHPPGNSAESVGATMQASAPEGEIEKRDLAQDDINALCFLYPYDEENQECFGVVRTEPPDVKVSQAGCQEQGPPVELGCMFFFQAFLRRDRKNNMRKLSRGEKCLS